MGKYKTPTYYGGKKGKAAWINGYLPVNPDASYIEPFAGMASVLFLRQPVITEILNDINERVVNWFRAVRDQPEEFGRLIENTPHSRTEFNWAATAMDDIDLPPIRRALAFHIAISQSIINSDNLRHYGWRRGYAPVGAVVSKITQDDITTIARRLSNVQLECVDACDLLERVFDIETIIYADPPYRTADTEGYNKVVLDVDRLAQLFRAQRGFVAISGYNDEWDMLGWHKYYKDARRHQIATQKAEKRTEVLWCNRQIQPQLL